MNTHPKGLFRLLLPAALLAAGLGGFAHAAQQAAQQAATTEHYTLKQAIARALQNSQEVNIARLRYEAAQRATGVDRSHFLPNLYAGSGLAYTNGFPILAGGGAPAAFTLSYTQALLDPVGHAEQRADEQGAEQQRLAMQGVRDSVIVSVASSYLELGKVRREVDLLHAERQSALKILDYIRQRVAAGYELPIEITKVQLTSARIEQRLEQLEDQDEILSDQLRQQLNLGPDQAIEVEAEDIPPAADRTVNDLVNDALESSVELKEAHTDEAAAAARLKGQRRSYLPTISVVGQYNLLTKFNDYTEFFNKFQQNNGVAGLQISMPLFASRHSAGVALAEATLNVAKLSEENKRNELTLDVRRQAHHAREMDTNREIARLEMDVAQQNLQIVEAQYQQGRASTRDVESAQVDEQDKNLALLDAEFARQQAQLNLLRSTGQLAMIYP